MTTPRERELEALLAVERQARRDAEAATAAREEILAVVSHDLRNPLGTILMGASTLVHGADPGDPKTARLRGIADRMQRQAERMSRMLQDLGDFSAILGGRFTIDAGRTAARTVLEACVDAITPLAADREMPVEAALVGDVPALECELDRVVQLVVVLAAVGVKVGARAAPIGLTLAPDPAGIALALVLPLAALTDEDLPRLFERGWRSGTPGYTGAGLAFALARGIAVAHGGELRASRVTASTIAFTAILPAAPTSP